MTIVHRRHSRGLLFSGAFLLLLIGVVEPANAQSAGLVLGLTSSSVFMGTSTPSEPGATSAASSRYSGAIMGGYFSTDRTRRVSMDVEGVYVVRGVRVAPAADRLGYLAAPVLVRASLGRVGPLNLHVVAGPSFAFRITARDIASNTGLGDQVKRFDLGLVVGGGFQIRTYTVELRYERGLTNIARNGGVLGTGTMKNRTVAVLVMLPLR